MADFLVKLSEKDVPGAILPREKFQKIIGGRPKTMDRNKRIKSWKNRVKM